jgi:D-alanyl-D-alanine carboxypeptidase
VPALGAALVEREAMVACDVVGERVRGGGVPATVGDPWHIGSCGKSITCMHYARLVEAGRAAWGATIGELLPDMTAGAHPAWAGIDIDAVLVHRAGLPEVDAHVLDRYAHDTRPLPEQRTELVGRALATAPRTPGTFGYSNLGYVLAGAAIERITGVQWEQALAADVLAPLGIADGGFGPAGDATWGHAPRWRGHGRGPARAPGDPRADNPPVLGPAGRLHLTLEAWSRVLRVVLGEGGDLLRPVTVAHLLEPPAGPGPRQAMGWAFPEGDAARAVAFGAQGSNRHWVATALVSAGRDRAALVVCNDGRARLLPATAALAVDLLRAPADA